MTEQSEMLKGDFDAMQKWIDAAKSVNEYTDGMVENLQRAKEGIEMLLDMQDRVACHTITKLVKNGYTPGRKLRIADGNGGYIGVFTIIAYNSDSLHCTNEKGEDINASYKAILKTMELGRCELLEE